MTHNEAKVIAGLDIGNGYTKGVLHDGAGHASNVDIPSAVMVVPRPAHLPVPDSAAVEYLLTPGDSLFNKLDASFITPLVNEPYRHRFGSRSLVSGSDASFREFNVVGKKSKAEQGLSSVLVLGCIAAKAVEDHVRNHGQLPGAGEPINVKAVVALALPIGEYMNHRVSYAARFKQGIHTVVVHNFETPVSVNIDVLDVPVAAEGMSAQFAITDKGEPLMETMLADVRRHGMALSGVTAADILASTNTIGIDIGEGTVNFPVFSTRIGADGEEHGEFNADASATFSKGYGNVLTSAITDMGRVDFGGFRNRKQLAEFLQTTPKATKRDFYNQVKLYVDETADFFAREVAEEFGRVLDSVGVVTEVAYVYGGGAGQVKDVLYDLLLDKVREMTGGNSFPVLYLDSRYSRHLNREGLLIAADFGAKRLGLAA